MMMQMIVEAGLPAFVDDHRPPDASNPRGYLEHAAARRLDREPTGLDGAVGLVVKVVSPLLEHLPRREDGVRYRVVFMRRAIEEVLRSQATMLAALGQSGDASADAALGRALERSDERARRVAAERDDMDVLEIDHRDLIAGSTTASRRVAQFVLDHAIEPERLERMVATADPDLYRARSDVASVD